MEIERLNPDISWRSMEKIKNGELKIELLTIEECIKRYGLTKKQIKALKPKK